MKHLLFVATLLAVSTLFLYTQERVEAKLDTALPGNTSSLLQDGAGSSGEIPGGLLAASGIQKKLPLVISNVVASSTTASTTVITWSTNKSANSNVAYWVGTTSTTSLEVFQNIATTSHTLLIGSLEANSLYTYYITSIDLYGNVATSGTSTFMTLADYPDIPTEYQTPEVDRTVPTIELIGEIDGLNDPAGVNVDQNGNIYVADYHNDNVKVYDSSLSLIQTLGDERGSDPGQFSEPWDIAFDSLGNVFVTDTNNQRVQVFS